MNKITYIILILTVSIIRGFGQKDSKQDTVSIEEVIIKANRIPFKLKNNPGAVSLVNSDILKTMPKTSGAEEALRLVPGVRVENQHNGERVHISIRGQGILTERGLRGIGVFLDGIPLNDPSGFVPDLYDIDWAIVKKTEVLRGTYAGLYGSGASGGLLNITAICGGEKPFEGIFEETAGSYGFYKTLLQSYGSTEKTDYGLSVSKSGSEGYRIHQGFKSNKLYEKIRFHPVKNLILTQTVSHIDYFHQNPEGLNLSQTDNPQAANPDAVPFNEYQKTKRTSLGLSGKYKPGKKQEINGYVFYRTRAYKETSNKYAEYGNYDYPGAGIRYNFNVKTGKVLHILGVGSDYKFQNIKIYKLKSEADTTRTESLDETNIETDSLLANQIIEQSGTGFFSYYRLNFKKFNFTGNFRYDILTDELTDKTTGENIKTKTDFSETSFRFGASLDFSEEITSYVAASKGFIPPSTEELTANPLGYSGFNTGLVPATSVSFETGIRGYLNRKLFYDITAFKTDTENDFFRFKQSGRGNQEVFYGNAGNSRRYGVETFFSFDIFKNLKILTSYTFADYKYTSAQINPVYVDTGYVLTKPPAAGQYLPDSPKHSLYSEIVYKYKNLELNLAGKYVSEIVIYTDADAYAGKLDPSVYQNIQEGYGLFNAEISYNFKIKKTNARVSVFARNFTGTSYMAFTEPDPDGNSYHPAPGREFFVTFKIGF